jgi:hypothetical protein
MPDQPPQLRRPLRPVHAGSRHADRFQVLPRDTELLAFEAGRGDDCERESTGRSGKPAACTCSEAPAVTSHREIRRRSVPSSRTWPLEH